MVNFVSGIIRWPEFFRLKSRKTDNGWSVVEWCESTSLRASRFFGTGPLQHYWSLNTLLEPRSANTV